MTNQFKIKQPLCYQKIMELLQQKKVQHAYLIETNFIKNKEEYVLEFVENLFLANFHDQYITKEQLHKYIVENHFPDLKILKPTGNVIKKEELIDLKESLCNKSVYNGYQIYIIYDAEKLNSSSANTILKFLEEPEENIIAVLVTNSRYQMLDTILSRCQILSFQQEDSSMQFSRELLSFIELFSERKQKDLMLSFQLILDEIFQNREQAAIILSEMENFFAQLLKNCYGIYLNSDFVEQYKTQFSEPEILNILSVIESKKNELDYNINFKAWVDSFLLQLMEV